MQNASLPPSKRSRIERQMDIMILLMFVLLFALCMIGAVFFAVWTKTKSPKMWYLEPSHTTAAFDPQRPVLAGVYSFVTSFVLYGYLIPISLYVSLEMVKVPFPPSRGSHL
jgi:magnesium-transporting ATPase (P-type)